MAILDPNLKYDPRDYQDPSSDYAQEVCPDIVDPALKAAVAEYASRAYHGKTSQQNVEAWHQQKEAAWEQSRVYQWLKSEEYADEGPRIAEKLHSSKLLLRLRKIGLVCFYKNDPVNGLIGLWADRHGELDFCTGVQYGWMPAFSVMRFDRHGIPTTEKYRGFWTVLLRLILDGYLTEAQVISEFGEPKGPAAVRTKQILYALRNTPPQPQ